MVFNMSYELRENKTFDSKAEETNDGETYRHRHIDIDILNTNTNTNVRKKERRFYVPVILEFTFQRLEKILAREGSSISHWIQQNAINYVRLHEPGNPQQRIDTILKNGQAYRAKPLCSCGALATRKVHLVNNETVFCCSRHMPKRGVKHFKELKPCL